MFNFIRGLTGARKLKKNKEAYDHGYDYAAGSLLRGEKTAYELEVEADTPSEWNLDEEHRSFDRGINDAVDKLISLGIVKDTRFNPNGPQQNSSYLSRHSPQSLRDRPSLRLISSAVNDEN